MADIEPTPSHTVFLAEIKTTANLQLSAAAKWAPWEGDPPELGPVLSEVELPLCPGGGAPPVWWHGGLSDDMGTELWALVGGDSGVDGPYRMAVYALAFDGIAPRFPTFEEWSGLAAAVCLPGAFLSCGLITGSNLIEPPEGRVLVLVQTSIVEHTPAGHRWHLTQAPPPAGGRIIHG